MNDLVSREYLLSEYDRRHKGPAGGARKLIEEAPEAVVRCKDCKHRRVNEHYGEDGYLPVYSICKLDTGDPFMQGRESQTDEWYCADGEKSEESGEPSGSTKNSIVRCGDCEYWDNGRLRFECPFEPDYEQSEEDYCSRGRRKNG